MAMEPRDLHHTPKVLGEDVIANAEFKVFPTLVKDNIFISVQSDVPIVNYEINIYNVQGALVESLSQNDVPIREIKHFIPYVVVDQQ